MCILFSIRDRLFYKKRRSIRLLAILLSIILLFTFAIPSFALTDNTKKEEVVYINLNNDGSVDGIYVVNSFELNKDGQIIDYGDYTSFREMTDSGKIKVDKEQITIDAKTGKLYYEGTLSDNTIPWIFNIRYFINKKEYTADEISGKSGKLEIKIAIRENRDVGNEFFDHYPLQVSLKLNTYICKNIKADGATIANAGKEKQIVFTVLPGRKADLSVTANVTNFEMDGISINGVPMSMDFDFKEDSSYQKKLSDLKNGVQKLDNGAQELSNGTKKLTYATGELRTGISDISKGSLKLKDATGKFVDGTKVIVEGTEKLNTGVKDLENGSSKLVDGTKELNDGMYDLHDGARKLSNGISLLDTNIAKLVKGADNLNKGMNNFHNGIVNLQNGTLQLQSGLTKLTNQNENLITLSNEFYNKTLEEATQTLGLEQDATEEVLYMCLQNPEFNEKKTIIEHYLLVLNYYKGIIAYVEGTTSISLGMDNLVGGVTSLSSGSKQLKVGSGELYDGIQELKDGTSKLADNALLFRDGTAELHNGIFELNDGTVKLNNGIIELEDGSNELLNGVIELKDSSIELNNGSIKISDGIIQLLDGAIELHEGTLTLNNGTIALAEGTLEFRNKTANIDNDIKQIFKKKLKEITGGDFTPVSFVSKKNKNVTSVQFTIQTQGIKIPETNEAVIETTDRPDQPSFWERFLSLFGL
jgi:putative membrane protein